MEATTWCWSWDTTARSRLSARLQAAADVLERSPGRLEVVFVAHMPATAAFSPEAIHAFREGSDHEAQDLESKVEEALASKGVKWHLQRRNGEIASELVTAGEEQLAGEGPDTKVVLVVGGSAHKIDRYLNSTPSKVIRHDRFEVFVVP